MLIPATYARAPLIVPPLLLQRKDLATPDATHGVAPTPHSIFPSVTTMSKLQEHVDLQVALKKLRRPARRAERRARRGVDALPRERGGRRLPVLEEVGEERDRVRQAHRPVVVRIHGV